MVTVQSEYIDRFDQMLDKIATISDRVAATGFDWDAAEKEAVTKCNCCGSRRFHLVWQHDRYYLPAATYRCWICGLMWISPRLTQNGYRRFYRDHYRDLVRVIDPDYCAETLALGQRQYVALVLPALVNVLVGKEGGRAIDIGGSTGLIAAAMAERYKLDMTVLDPSAEELSVAAASGLRTIVGVADDLPTEPKWDVISIIQSVEHLPDIAGAFSRVCEALAPDGVFLVDWCEATPKLDHCYTLCCAVMSRYLNAAGFQIIQAFDFFRHRLYACRKHHG